MLLKCVLCNRPLDKAEFFIGGYPVGSTCAKNRGLSKLRNKFTQSIAIRNNQRDLFEGEENDEKKSIDDSAS